MSDAVLRERMRVEFERHGMNEKDWAARVLGTEQRRFYLLSRKPLRQDSESVRITRAEDSGLVTRFIGRDPIYRTPIVTVDDIFELMLDQQLTIWDSLTKCTIVGGIGPDYKTELTGQ